MKLKYCYCKLENVLFNEHWCVLTIYVVEYVVYKLTLAFQFSWHMSPNDTIAPAWLKTSAVSTIDQQPYLQDNQLYTKSKELQANTQILGNYKQNELSVVIQLLRHASVWWMYENRNNFNAVFDTATPNWEICHRDHFHTL